LACDFFSVETITLDYREAVESNGRQALPDPVDDDTKVIRRDRLSGILHEYA
jgi:hypothetical protein